MALDISEMGTNMFQAASGVLEGKGPALLNYAKEQCDEIAKQIADIETQRAQGLSEENAHTLLQLTLDSAMQLPDDLATLGALVLEQAINAALAVVKGTVNTAMHFTLI